MNDADLKERRRGWRLPAAWTVLIAFDLCLVALAVAQDDPVVDPTPPIETQVVQIDGPADVAVEATRFEAIDVFVDPGDQPLAAYQFELASRTPGVEIVGIEGGEHEAFSDAPYFDPRAMQQNRVIIAAFKPGANANLPAGRSRVARIHVQLQGPGVKEYETRLSVSATVGGRRIPAQATVARSDA